MAKVFYAFSKSETWQTFKFKLAILLFLALPHKASAQIGFTCNLPTGAPLDGGLSLFVLASSCYGIRKIKEKFSYHDEENL
jgi:hypothetical protein